MDKNLLLTDIGFTDEEVPVGTHMCLIYTSDEERSDTLLKYLLSGMAKGERSACFSDNITEEEIRCFFRENGISYDERKSEGMIALSGAGEVYFEDNKFDPDRMLSKLVAFYDSAKTDGLPASRVIGEMLPEVKTTPGGEELLNYEAEVSLLVKTRPITTVCQYNANDFDGATIMEIMKVHPRLIVNGAVVHNPLYVEPEVYLRKN